MRYLRKNYVSVETAKERENYYLKCEKFIYVNMERIGNNRIIKDRAILICANLDTG